MDQNLLVTGDKVEMAFRSDYRVEQRGYYLVLTLVSQASVSCACGFHTIRGTIKKLTKLFKFTKFIWRALHLKILGVISKTKTGTRDSSF